MIRNGCNHRPTHFSMELGPLVQFVGSLTADQGVVSSIPARSHTFMEIDREIISTVILILPLIQEGLLSVMSVTSKSMCMKYWLSAQSNLPSVIR